MSVTSYELKILDQCSALQRLSAEEKQKLGQHMIVREYPASTVIWRLGEPPRACGLYLVISGEVSVVYHGPKRTSSSNRTVTAGAIFGESTVRRDGSSTIGARTQTPVKMLFLPRETYENLLREISELSNVVEDLEMLRALEPEVLSAMRRSALARHFSARTLADLCDVAEILRFDSDAVVLQQGESAPGFFFVVSGELKVTVHDGNHSTVLVDTLHPGDVFGDVALITGLPQPSTVTTWSPVRLARVRVEAYNKMLDGSQTHRRGVRNLTVDHEDGLAPLGVATAHDGPARQGETRLMVSSVRAPTGVLALLLAETLANDHGDHVLVVSFPRPGSHTSTPEVRGTVVRMDLVTDDANASDRLGELLSRVRKLFDYILLNAAERGDTFLAGVALHVDRVVHLTDNTYEPLRTQALHQRVVLHAVLLGISKPTREITTMPTMHSGTVRLRIDLDTLARRVASSPTVLPEHEQESIRRLARAVSNRRVGVALGGGGSWGYAHLPLLQRMKAHKIPVDLIAGCSFGALVGAYWCAQGERGAEKLLRNSKDLRRAVLLSLVSSRAIASMVEKDLGKLLLEEMDVPFFPVATDVATGAQRAIKSGRVGRGVRASGSFPGVFGPVTSKGFRLVDGGIVNNVPEDVLVQEGADLVIASNVVSQPAAMKTIPQPFFGGEAGRFIHEVNPIGRVSDLVRSTLILMHSAGSRDAHLADVTYNAEPMTYLPWDFDSAEDIARCAAPEVERVLVQINSAWQRLAKPAALRGAIDAASLVLP
jgi:predicted acylesterase/phospholipase RssA/CRP-like cAMP-binding protein